MINAYASCISVIYKTNDKIKRHLTTLSTKLISTKGTAVSQRLKKDPKAEFSWSNENNRLDSYSDIDRCNSSFYFDSNLRFRTCMVAYISG